MYRKQFILFLYIIDINAWHSDDFFTFLKQDLKIAADLENKRKRTTVKLEMHLHKGIATITRGN